MKTKSTNFNVGDALVIKGRTYTKISDQGQPDQYGACKVELWRDDTGAEWTPTLPFSLGEREPEFAPIG